MAASFAALGALAALSHRFLLRLDEPVQRAVVGAREDWATDVILGVSLLGTRYVVGALLLVLGAWVLATGRCRVVLFVMVIAFALNPLAEWALKAAIGRPRPELMRLVRGTGRPSRAAT